MTRSWVIRLVIKQELRKEITHSRKSLDNEPGSVWRLQVNPNEKYNILEFNHCGIC